MAPNLFIFAKTAISPWTWCSIHQKASKKLDKTHLYFGKEPVRGIYAISPKGKRYLVAIRPNHNADVDRIFQMSKQNIPKCEKGNFAKSNKTPVKKNTTIYHQSTKNDDESAKPSTIQISVTERSRPTSPESTTSQNSTPITSRSRNDTNISWSSCKKSPIYCSDKPPNSVDFIMNNTGVLPHQKSPFGKDCHRYLRQTQASTRRRKTTGIDQIDLNGYRFLAKPLQVEYNNILSRWMFSAEIKLRTIIAPMCRSLICVERELGACGKYIVKRKLFCLDDGVSWVIGGAKRKMPYRDGEFLFMVDEKTDDMRRQTELEGRRSRKLMEVMKGEFIVWDEKEDFVPLLRYMDVDFGNV